MRQPVAILSMHYPPEPTGVAPYAGDLAAGLSDRGHPVKAYAAHPFYPEWRIRGGYGQWLRSERIDDVDVSRMLHFVPRNPRGLARLLSELSFGARLLLRRLPSESVVIALSPALFSVAIVALRIRLTPRRWRPKLILWVQDIYTLGLIETQEGGRFTRSITRMVEEFVSRSADRVVAIHPRFATYLQNVLHVRPERVSVIRNWTHLEPSPAFARHEARIALGWPEDVYLAVHTGNMGAKQGLQNIVAAARLADEQQAPIKFILVGHGGERAALECLAQGIERIAFVDPLSASDYRLALAAADCLVVNELPGVSEMAVPSKLTSYFDARRPVLAATDPGGITAGEVEQAKAGVVIPAGEPQALLEIALRISANREQAEAYGAAGRRYRMEVLDSNAAITAFEKVIQDVARG